jgi:hypothetical protein
LKSDIENLEKQLEDLENQKKLNKQLEIEEHLNLKNGIDKFSVEISKLVEKCKSGLKTSIWNEQNISNHQIIANNQIISRGQTSNMNSEIERKKIEKNEDLKKSEISMFRENQQSQIIETKDKFVYFFDSSADQITTTINVIKFENDQLKFINLPVPSKFSNITLK